jgi:hypothetical protein
MPVEAASGERSASTAVSCKATAESYGRAFHPPHCGRSGPGATASAEHPLRVVLLLHAPDPLEVAAPIGTVLVG